jgi:putative flippase GtrA
MSQVLFSKLRTSEIVAANLAFIFAAGWNYITHYRWTFASERPHISTISRFCLMNVFGFSLNWLVIAIGTRVFAGNLLVVQLIAIGLVVLSNLVIRTVWVFGGGGAPSSQR